MTAIARRSFVLSFARRISQSIQYSVFGQTSGIYKDICEASRNGV